MRGWRAAVGLRLRQGEHEQNPRPHAAGRKERG